MAERGIDLDGEGGIDAPQLRAKSVALFDAVLGVAPIATHIPLAGRAVHARLRIGLTHDADNQITDGEPGVSWRLLHPAERFVSKDEPRLSRRSSPKFPFHDLAIRPTDPERERTHEHAPARAIRFRNVLELY